MTERTVAMMIMITMMVIGAMIPSFSRLETARAALSSTTTGGGRAAAGEHRHAQALDLALAGDLKGAARVLRELLDGKSAAKISAQEKDRVRLSLGRVLYQLKDFDEALEAYMAIKPGAPAWFEALEERAWTNMQLARPEEALSQLKTLLSPLFKDRVSAEPYFLASLAQLRVCDYSNLFKTVNQFKDRFRDKLKTWRSSSSSEAQAQIKLTGEMIQKITLVEAEAIQRLYIDEDPKARSGDAPKVTKAPGQLSFPVTETDEVWMDEVNNVRVSVKGCPVPKSEQQASGQASIRDLGKGDLKGEGGL